MNDRRRALLARFRSSAKERLGRMSLALVDLDEGRGSDGHLQDLARDLHTLKGECNMLGFAPIGAALHAAETALGGCAPEVYGVVRRTLGAVERAIDEDPPFSDASGAFAAVAEELRAITDRVDAGPSKQDAPRAPLRRPDVGASAAVHDAAGALDVSPVDPLLGDLAQHAHDLAAAQGKRVRVTTRSGGVSLPRALLDDLWEPLLHVVRNAVDHGLEAPGDRGDKPAEATISISAETLGADVVLSVEDDGRGVDPAGVRAAAVRRGMFGADAARALSDCETLDLLFWHGFSTRASISEISGRGVGLDVVRSRVEALGGSAEITSTLGRGARLSITIPAHARRTSPAAF